LASSNLLDYVWASAEQEFKRCLELNPNYSLAHFHYALALASMDRFKEGVNEVLEGQKREPMSPLMNAGVAFIQSVAAEEDRGMLDKCVQQSLTNLEIAPTVTLSYLVLGMCYEQKHMYKEAVQSFQKGIDVGGPYALLRAFEAHAYGHSGDKAKAREILVELKDLARHSYISLAHLATVYDGLGERDLEIETLEQAYENRDPFLIYISDAYFYDGLRSDPRFQDLERKIGVRQ
jgi:tetratricopeptide (TPR) repeat protein